jgi:hypothetical protein
MNLPKDPSGSGPLGFWLKQLKEFVRRRQVIRIEGYRQKQTPNGIIYEKETLGVSGGSRGGQCPY